MNEYTEIRRENLKALKLTVKALQYQVGNSVTYWYDLLRGDKDFGEKIARKIEVALGLPVRILDEPGSCGPQLIGSAPAPTSRRSNEQAAPVPLANDTLVLAKWFEKLPEDSMMRMQVYATIMQTIINAMAEAKADQPVAASTAPSPAQAVSGLPASPAPAPLRSSIKSLV